MALGDIIGLLDSEVFAQQATQPPILRKRNKNIVLLCSSNLTDNLCLVRSIAITDLGIIDATPEDSLALGADPGRDMGLIHWLDDIFAVISNSTGGVQHLWTVACNGNGVIPATPTDYMSLGGATNMSIRSDLLKPHPNVLLIGQTNSVTPVMVQTAIISDAGLMGDTPADSMDLPLQPRIQRLRHGLGDRIVELYRDGGKIYISTYTCTDAGGLPANVIDSWEVAVPSGDHMALSKVSNTVYVMFVKHTDNTGMLHTFSINANGTINKSYLDSEQVEAVVHTALEMTEMGAGFFILGYRFDTNTLRVKTYFIADSGAIQNGHISTLDRAFSDVSDLFFEHLNGDIWTLIFTSPGTSIHLDTLDVETPTEAVPHHEMIMKIGP
ncbi:hypothetical protein ES702_06764 [subsurface metagenome]